MTDSIKKYLVYQTRATILEMLDLRGYDTAPYANITPADLETQMRMGLGLLDIVCKHKDNPEKEVQVKYWLDVAPKPAMMKAVRNLVRNEVLQPGSELVLIVGEPIHAAIHADVYALYKDPEFKLLVSVFNIKNLIINPLRHERVPLHEKVPANQVANVLKECRAESIRNLPKIQFHEDFIARFIGLVPDEVCRVYRSSPTAGVCERFYRVCVA
jgi:DNA-directed RNA polymerase subunit H (RpoH/RPB5)